MNSNGSGRVASWHRLSQYLPILGYHRVGPYRNDHVPTVSAEAFERHLTFLARHRYRVLSLLEVAGQLDRGETVPSRSTVITFDDGYEETHTVAWPLLKRFGFPATVFVCPGEVGLPGFATWKQLTELSRDGIVIGCHTMHHSYIPVVKPERLPEELVDSKRAIEERIGQPVQLISYPVGGFTMQARTMVEGAGYLAACTTNRISPIAWVDRFALRRIKMTERDRSVTMLVKLSGYYDLFRQLKQPS